MSVFEMPNRLYITTDTVMTITYGTPSAKYNEGIQIQGERTLPCWLFGSSCIILQI